jgi:dephospho-CoA kinase
MAFKVSLLSLDRNFCRSLSSETAIDRHAKAFPFPNSPFPERVTHQTLAANTLSLGKRMLLVGLTGGIATGKSTVSALLQQEPYSLPVIDADILARKAVEPGTRTFTRILQTFGQDLALRDENGKIMGLDRAALGSRVFTDESARKKLNGIVHPAVRWLIVKAVIWEWLVRGSRVVILDIPLLFESGLDRFLGLSVVVATRKEVQLERLMARDQLNEEAAKGRIASQWDIEEKVRLADIVIDNNGSRAELAAGIGAVEVREQLSRGALWTLLLRVPPVGLVVAWWVFLRRLQVKKMGRKAS